MRACNSHRDRDIEVRHSQLELLFSVWACDSHRDQDIEVRHSQLELLFYVWACNSHRDHPLCSKKFLCVVRLQRAWAQKRVFFILRVFYFEGCLCKALPLAGLKNCLFQKDLHNKPYMPREGLKTEIPNPWTQALASKSFA